MQEIKISSTLASDTMQIPAGCFYHQRGEFPGSTPTLLAWKRYLNTVRLKAMIKRDYIKEVLTCASDVTSVFSGA